MSTDTAHSEPTILDSDDVSFCPERMTIWVNATKLTPSTASTITREFESCPHCNDDLDLDVKNGKLEDRDVVWADRTRGSESYECPDCGHRFRILVEEKAWGIIGESQVPSEISDDVHFVDVPDSSEVLVINTHQIMFTPVE
jgi:hypothetical protein